MSWNIINGSVFVENMKRLGPEYGDRPCKCCERLFHCGRNMQAYETQIVNDAGGKEKKVVYKCEYEKCEWMVPAEWEFGSKEYNELAEQRILWSGERLLEREKEFPGAHLIVKK